MLDSGPMSQDELDWNDIKVDTEDRNESAQRQRLQQNLYQKSFLPTQTVVEGDQRVSKTEVNSKEGVRNKKTKIQESSRSNLQKQAALDTIDHISSREKAVQGQELILKKFQELRD